MTPVTFAGQMTPGGYKCGEVTSALQKSIRRGFEEEALFWASELELAGFGNYVWKRLKIISSEDIGLGDTQTVIAVKCLFDNWVEMRKTVKPTDEKQPGRLFMVHAILLLCRAPKSRIVDHAKAVYFDEHRHQDKTVRPTFEIPEYSLDKHTSRGARMGRGWDHFFDEATTLFGEADLEDEYRERARQALTGQKPARRRSRRKT